MYIETENVKIHNNNIHTTHLIIVFVGTFSSIIYFKQLCNKRSFLGTTTLEKKEQIKKEEERGIV